MLKYIEDNNSSIRKFVGLVYDIADNYDDSEEQIRAMYAELAKAIISKKTRKIKKDGKEEKIEKIQPSKYFKYIDVRNLTNIINLGNELLDIYMKSDRKDPFEIYAFRETLKKNIETEQIGAVYDLIGRLAVYELIRDTEYGKLLKDKIPNLYDVEEVVMEDDNDVDAEEETAENDEEKDSIDVDSYVFEDLFEGESVDETAVDSDEVKKETKRKYRSAFNKEAFEEIKKPLYMKIRELTEEYCPELSEKLNKYHKDEIMKKAKGNSKEISELNNILWIIADGSMFTDYYMLSYMAAVACYTKNKPESDVNLSDAINDTWRLFSGFKGVFRDLCSFRYDKLCNKNTKNTDDDEKDPVIPDPGRDGTEEIVELADKVMKIIDVLKSIHLKEMNSNRKVINGVRCRVLCFTSFLRTLTRINEYIAQRINREDQTLREIYVLGFLNFCLETTVTNVFGSRSVLVKSSYRTDRGTDTGQLNSKYDAFNIQAYTDYLTVEEKIDINNSSVGNFRKKYHDKIVPLAEKYIREFKDDIRQIEE